MQEELKIWIDRLVEGRVQKINTSCDPSFLEIDEKELQFRSPVKVTGQAYLAEQHLVIHLAAFTKATLPCAICNEMVETDLKIEDFYHTEALSDIRDAVFDFGLPLREALLLELPTHFECRKGNCPARSSLAPYLRSSSQRKDKGEGTSHFPFADL